MTTDELVVHEIARVDGVHLPSGWHDCQVGTFEVREDGCYGDPGPPAMKAQCRCFTFTEPDGHQVSGPLLSVMALRTPG